MYRPLDHNSCLLGEAAWQSHGRSANGHPFLFISAWLGIAYVKLHD